MIALAIVMDRGEILLAGSTTVAEVLEGYYSWYRLIINSSIILAIVFGIIGIIVVGLYIRLVILDRKHQNVATFKNSNKSDALRQLNIDVGASLAMVVFAILPLIPLQLVTVVDGTVQHRQYAEADLQALDNNDLVILEIDHLGDGIRARLPEPTGGNVTNMLRRLNMRTTDGENIRIYMLEREHEQLAETVRQVNADRLAYGNIHGNHRDIGTHFEVTITPYFNLVINVEIINTGWEWNEYE